MTSAVITGLVLIFLNIYCAQYSQELFYESKRSTMVATAQLTANEIAGADVLSSSSAAAIIGRLGHENMDRLIVTDAGGMVLYDSRQGTDVGGYALFPQIVKALSGYDIFTWNYDNGMIRAVAASPILGYESVSGCVYLLQYDRQQGYLIQSLLSGIFTITCLLEIGLLMFALIYASRFSSRLRRIMASMRIIQEGDYTHKVSLSGNDELSILGREFNDLTERLQTSESKRR